MNSIPNLSPAQLRKAASIQEKIQSLQKKLSQILGATVDSARSEAPRKRKISAAGLASIRAAQKARWAKIKRTKSVKKGKSKL
jgi:hypothetical protein